MPAHRRRHSKEAFVPQIQVTHTMRGALARRLSLLAALLVLAANASAEPELKGNPGELRQFLAPEPNTVVIQGHAEKTAYADRAIVSLVVTTSDRKLAGAIARNHSLRAGILKTLTSAGIASTAIRNANFSSTPEYGWFGHAPERYTVNNRMAVTIDSEAQLETLARIADEAPEIVLVQTDVEHGERKAYLGAVTRAALEEVMQRKADYEKTLGVRLEAVAFDTPDARTHASPGAEAMARKRQIQSVPSGASFAKSAPLPEPAPAFDEIVYAAEVSVSFRIVRP